MKQRVQKDVIGWREWVSLPDLSVSAIKAKVDTGARTSALHAYDVQIFREGDRERVRFKVHPFQRDTRQTVNCEADLLTQRWVRSSGGRETLRPVIETTVELLGQCWRIEVTLIQRGAMGFRMLLGRQALRRRLTVDPGRSFIGGRPDRPGKRQP